MSTTTYPSWTWADGLPFTEALRVETAFNTFIDYVRVSGVWRQKTRAMTDKESVTPEKHWIGDWRDGAKAWPEADAGMAGWLETTYNAIGGTA